jgi:hypothetical protein
LGSACSLTGKGGGDLMDTLYQDVETLLHTLALHPLHVLQHVEQKLDMLELRPELHELLDDGCYLTA